MGRLILMRHAEAASGNVDLWRPLSGRGMDDAERMGTWLRGRNWIPDEVLISPATRTQQTAAQVIAAAGAVVQPTVRAELYGGGVAVYEEVFAAATGDNILLVGHDPTITHLIHKWAPMTATSADGRIAPPGTISVFEDGRQVAIHWPSEPSPHS
jgi:phosphohistidine phosphatase